MMHDIQLFKAYQDHNDVKARDQLLKRYEALAYSLARRYEHKGENIEDLQQVAMLGLVQAINRFSEKYNRSFATFAIPTINGELKRYFRDKTWSVRVPRSIQELSLKIEPAQEHLLGALGRQPTEQEIAEYLEVSIHQIEEAKLALNSYNTLSLNAPVNNEQESGERIDFTGKIEPKYVQTETKMVIDELLACLSKQEQQIIQSRFYQDKSQVEISQELGISQMQVSRTLKRALLKLAKEGKHIQNGEALSL